MFIRRTEEKNYSRKTFKNKKSIYMFSFKLTKTYKKICAVYTFRKF